MSDVDMERLDPEIHDVDFLPPLSEQIAHLNRLGAYIKHHKQKRSLLDMSRYLKVRGPWEG